MERCQASISLGHQRVVFHMHHHRRNRNNAKLGKELCYHLPTLLARVRFILTRRNAARIALSEAQIASYSANLILIGSLDHLFHEGG